MASVSDTHQEWEDMRESINGLPGFQKRSSTVIADEPLTGRTTTWIVETWRADGKDTIFLQHVGAEGGQRFVLPPKAVEAIYRQHYGIVKKSKSDRAKRGAETGKAKGVIPFETKEEREARLAQEA